MRNRLLRHFALFYSACLTATLIIVTHQSACAISLNNNDAKAFIYIDTYKELAIREMHRMGVPASITLAQGMLESNFGESRLAQKGKNHFGIKCKSHWKGDTIKVNDDAPQECFRKYGSVLDSYIDHSDFLKYHRFNYYDKLFLLDRNDYKGWAYGLKKAGYATAPHYAESLIRFIERYRLYDYDYYTLAQLDLELRPTEPLPSDIASGRVKVQPKPKEPSSDPIVIAPTKPKPTPVPPVVSEADEAEAGMAIPLQFKELYINDRYAVIANKSLLSSFVAHRYDIDPSKLYKYNDLKPGARIPFNTPIYFEAKRRKASSGQVAHKVKRGESMYAIGQRYGIKMKNLYKLNRMRPGQEPAEGAFVALRKKAKQTPRLRG
ncbi:MAG: glucosaminidase domain-containing protein [Chitinophagales bacterium]